MCLFYVSSPVLLRAHKEIMNTVSLDCNCYSYVMKNAETGRNLIGRTAKCTLELHPYWVILDPTIYVQCQRSVSMKEVVSSDVESNGVGVGVVDGHVACATFVQETGICGL